MLKRLGLGGGTEKAVGIPYHFISCHSELSCVIFLGLWGGGLENARR